MASISAPRSCGAAASFHADPPATRTSTASPIRRILTVTVPMFGGSSWSVKHSDRRIGRAMHAGQCDVGGVRARLHWRRRKLRSPFGQRFFAAGSPAEQVRSVSPVHARRPLPSAPSASRPRRSTRRSAARGRHPTFVGFCRIAGVQRHLFPGSTRRSRRRFTRGRAIVPRRRTPGPDRAWISPS